jgi:mono/diheme cytochrome c family protein
MIRPWPAAIVVSAAFGALVWLAAHGASPSAKAAALVERGRYLVTIAGCNDCHTEGYARSAGKVPMTDWLEGSTLGWHGPWGTSYAVNLRLLVNHLTRKEWHHLVETARPKPPMPWWALRAMTRADQSAVYAFIRSLGPAGKEAPPDLPPGVAAPPPAVLSPMPPPKAAR